MHYLLSSLFYIYWIWTLVQLRCSFQLFRRSQGLLLLLCVIIVFSRIFIIIICICIIYSHLSFIFIEFGLSSNLGVHFSFSSDLMDCLLLLFVVYCHLLRFYNYILLMHYLLSSVFYMYWIWTFVQLRCTFQCFRTSQGLFIICYDFQVYYKLGGALFTLISLLYVLNLDFRQT